MYIVVPFKNSHSNSCGTLQATQGTQLSSEATIFPFHIFGCRSELCTSTNYDEEAELPTAC